MPLYVAAAVFSVIGLAGPAMLAVGVDPRPYAWMIAPLWLVVMAGVGMWVRGFARIPAGDHSAALEERSTDDSEG